MAKAHSVFLCSHCGFAQNTSIVQFGCMNCRQVEEAGMEPETVHPVNNLNIIE